MLDIESAFGYISACEILTPMLRPKQSLGQNFLVDGNIARKIISAIDVKPDEAIIEIGPGKGALTKYLIELTDNFFAVEIDRRACEYLMSEYGDRLRILNGDFLEIDLQEISNNYHRKIRLVGNIPYHITSPILFKVMEHRAVVQDMTIMVQWEVAKRIVAKPKTKEYGILSVLCQFYAMPELLFKVSPSCFYPKPKVTSAVVRLDFVHSPHYQVTDENVFVQVVKSTFGKRRKTLRNGLKALKYQGFNIEALDFNLNLRPEELSVADFVTLSNLITIHRHHFPEDSTTE
jgi:16S rRNA (adenine1518-N6/adenine1519-N6)-dimethyltransferase